MTDHQARLKLKPAPKTPLKRVSRNSLRSLTLSASHPPPSSQLDHQKPGPSSPSSLRARPPTNSATDLLDHHLAPLFVDLADAVTDLHINLSNLDVVCQDLDGFNQAFAAFIYGLRMNSYTTEFEQAPKLASFQDAEAQKEADRQRVQAEALATHQEQEDHTRKNNLPEASQDDSFATAERSISNPSAPQKSSGPLNSRSKPTPTTTTRRTTHQPTASTSSADPQGRTKTAKSYSQSSKAQQRQLLKFSEPLLAQLPLKFREQQPNRQEMELVISALKLNPNGLYIKEIVKLESTVPMHRARECVTALVAAKKAVKLNKDGLLYKLLITN